MAIPHSKLIWLRVALVVAAGVWVFAPALRGDWLMDDDLYLTQNVLLNDPARLWKIWFAPGSLIEYYPIEATVQAVQWHFWHLETLGYHLTSLILHLISALLVWRLLAQFGLRLAWLGGFLFTVHPGVVESVAWISELKNTLSLPFFLLAMSMWINYVEHGRPRDYLLALGLFLIAMLCKISMALFPLVILLYAWWKRGRIGEDDLKAAAPFFAISLVLGLTTIWAGDWFREAHLQSAAAQRIGGFPARLALAGTSAAFYFSKCVWPVEMLPIYPKWRVDPPSLLLFLPWAVLAGVIGWLWSNRAGWGRHALLGLGFFFINLAPFVGFNSVSYMGFTWVWDHFLYLPLIGPIGLAIAALEDIDNRISLRLRPWLAGMTAVVLALLVSESHAYAGVFIGPEKLWTYTVERNPTSWLAHNNLGNILLETDRAPQAIEQYRESLQFNPEGVEAHNNLGFAFYQEALRAKTAGHPERVGGYYAEAIENYELALKYNPQFAIAQTNLAHALADTGRIAEAISHDEQALLINPQDRQTRAEVAKLRARQTAP